MPLLLYTGMAAILLWLAHRFVLRLSRPAAGILFLIPFVFTGWALVTSRVYGPVDHAWDTPPLNWMKGEYGLVAAHNGYLSDVSTQMIPWRAAVRNALAHGEWPLWNRFILSGDILAPAGQPAAFSPFTLLACLMPAALSMTFTAAIAHFLAALGAFLLARDLGWLMRSELVSHAAPVWGTYKIAAELIGLAMAIAVIALRAPQFLVAVVLLQRFVSDGDIYRTLDRRLAYPPIPIFEALRDTRDPFRITGHGLAFIPGTSALYELEDVRGYQAMTFLRYYETYRLWCVHQGVWFNRVDDLTRPFLSLLNVRYAITWDRDPPPPGWREVARQRGTMLIENTRVLGRAFVPHRVRIGHDALAEMANETDFGARAWIEAAQPPHELANGPGSVVTRARQLGYDLDVTMADAGYVVASLPAWSGWRASVDGRRVPTHFANHAFLAVHVPPGRHQVRLVFLPTSFVIGRAITLAALILIGAWWVRERSSFLGRIS